MQSEEVPCFFVAKPYELDLDPNWAEEYVEQRIDASDDRSNRVKDEDPDVTYSKFMRFMKQEGDVPIESGQRATASLDETAEEWIEQFQSNKQRTEGGASDSAGDHAVLNKAEDQLAVAGLWMDEFEREYSNTGF